MTAALRRKRQATNTGLVKVAVPCSAATFAVKIVTFAKPETVTCNPLAIVQTLA